MSGLGHVPSELGEAPPGHDASDVAAAKRVVEVLVERMPEAAARRMEAAGSLMLDFKDVSSVQYDTLCILEKLRVMMWAWGGIVWSVIFRQFSSKIDPKKTFTDSTVW
jgi:hypothetical protein